MAAGPDLCLAYAASPIHDRSFLSMLRERVGRLLSMTGLTGIRDVGVTTRGEELAARLRGCRAAVVVVATGGTEHIVLGGLAGLRGPALLVGHPYANSLPALLELYPLARKMGASAVALSSLEADAAGELGAGLRGLLAAARLLGARLGIVGRPSPWLVYSVVEPRRLKERLGVELVEIPMDRLVEVYRSVGVPAELLERVVSEAAAVERPREELEKALRLYAALERIVQEEKLDAFTIECFEVIPRLDTTACLALSLFNSRGVVAGCEGDIPATLSMMLLAWVSGSPVFMANPAVLGEEDLVLAHCTAPLAAGPYRLLSHFETGRGVGVSVEYPRGSRVTLTRLDPGLARLRIAGAEVLDSGLRSPLHCRTQVRLKPLGWRPRLLLEDSIGNHYVMAPGGHSAALSHAARMLGLEPEVLGSTGTP